MDVSNYWKERGERYYDEFDDQPQYEKNRMINQEKKMVEILQNNNFNSILEIGCGFGRYTKILNDIIAPREFIALDISEDQIKKAKKYVNDQKVCFICNKIQEFVPNEKYDLVFAGEILMHIKPSEIESIIKKMVECTSGKIITVDWYNDKKIGDERLGYCFMHDYELLFKKYGAINIKEHKISLSPKLKLISKYAQIRGRTGIGTQSIFEVQV